MVRIVSAFAAVVAINVAGAMAGRGHKKPQRKSAAATAFGGVVRAAGLAAAFGGVPAVSAESVHPLWHETRSDLGFLLSRPCDAIDAPGKLSRCPMEDRFRTWAFKYNKPYVELPARMDSSDEDRGASTVQPAQGKLDEYDFRLNAFAQNVAKAQAYNEKSQGESVHGITKFMDMPEEEFMAKRGGLVVDDAAYKKFKELPKASVQKKHDEFLGDKKSPNPWGESKDWAADGMTTAVKDQGQCGSCWAFSTVEQVESMALIQGIRDDDGSKLVLAPQELVSCDHNGDEGCNGGLPSNALEWLEKHPLEREADYPYMSGMTQHTGKCHKHESEGVVDVTSFKQISDGAEAEDDLHDYILNEGPASVGVDANSAWQTYVGGVLHAYQCDGQLDHAVQAVGINKEALTPYIKVRNSWADDWGEHGYIRLKAGTNTCGIANMAVTADVEKVDASTSSHRKNGINFTV